MTVVSSMQTQKVIERIGRDASILHRVQTVARGMTAEEGSLKIKDCIGSLVIFPETISQVNWKEVFARFLKIDS